jgi:hypothetical protein
MFLKESSLIAGLFTQLFMYTLLFFEQGRELDIMYHEKSGRVIPSEGTDGQYSNQRKVLVAWK